MNRETEGLRERIDELLRSEMVTVGVDIDDAKTGQMWAYDSERLSKQALQLCKDDGLRWYDGKNDRFVEIEL